MPVATSVGVSRGSFRRAASALGRTIEGSRDDPLTRNSVQAMANSLVNSALGFAFWLIAARLVAPSEVGAASACLSAALLASVVSDLGLRSLVMQDLPQMRTVDEWSAHVSATLILLCFSPLAGSLITWAIVHNTSPAIARLTSGGWILAFLLVTVATSFNLLLDGIALAHRVASQMLVRSVLTSVCKLTLLASLVFALSKTGFQIILATALALTISVIYGLHWQLRRVQPNWAFSLRGVVPAVRQLRGGIVAHHILTLSGFLPMYVIPLEVVTRLGPTSNAYFALTWQVAAVFFMVSPAIGGMLFVQGRWAPSTLKSTVRRSIRLTAWLMLPIALSFVALGHPLLSLFGSHYADRGYTLLCILAASAVPDAITNIQVGVLRARGQAARAAQLNAAMAIIAIVLAWLLLRPVGIVGGGLAWLLAQSVGALVVLVFAWRRRFERSKGAAFTA